ncbi:DCL-like protein [Wolffia australiana]
MAAMAAAAAAAAALRVGLGSAGRALRVPLSHVTGGRSRLFQAGAARPRREDPAVDVSGDDPRQSAEKLANLWGEILESKRYRDKEAAILKDIDPIRELTKSILHTDRYKDGERLTNEDEKAVVENLLVYHPHSEDKIGCGIDCIMVDRHPRFRNSRCLFVVRTDGVFIDFSYQKCLREYIKLKYPAAAERFIRENFKRGT